MLHKMLNKSPHHHLQQLHCTIYTGVRHNFSGVEIHVLADSTGILKPKRHNPTPSQSPGRAAQSVTCLATDACLTAIPGVASSIPARFYTFVEIDREIISTVILLPSADSFKKG